MIKYFSMSYEQIKSVIEFVANPVALFYNFFNILS